MIPVVKEKDHYCAQLPIIFLISDLFYHMLHIHVRLKMGTNVSMQKGLQLLMTPCRLIFMVIIFNTNNSINLLKNVITGII